jgi:hypothetical protein
MVNIRQIENDSDLEKISGHQIDILPIFTKFFQLDMV